MPLPRPRPLLLLALLSASTVGCTSLGHLQNEGPYAFTAEEVLRDDCGLVTGDALWDGTLEVAGDSVRLRYNLHEVQLVGEYREVEESFFLSGSTANVPTSVGNRDCVVDLVTINLDGLTDTPDAFAGTLRIHYEQPAACTCDTWVRYRAEHR